MPTSVHCLHSKLNVLKCLLMPTLVLPFRTLLVFLRDQDPQDVPQASQPTAVILKVTRHQFISCFWMQFRMFQVLSPYFTAPPKAVGSNSPAKNVVKRHDFENVQHVVDIVAHELARSARYNNINLLGSSNQRYMEGQNKTSKPKALSTNRKIHRTFRFSFNASCLNSPTLKMYHSTPLSHPKQCLVQPKNVGTYQFA